MESARIRKEEIEPINEFLLSFSRSRGARTKDLVNSTTEIRKKLTEARTSIGYNVKNLNLQNSVIAALNSEMEVLKNNYPSLVHTAYSGVLNDYTTLLNLEIINEENAPESIHNETLIAGGQIKCVDELDKLIDVAEPSFFRHLFEAIQQHSDMYGRKIKSDERTLKTLNDYDDEKMKMKTKTYCSDDHNADACPTCGQTLSDDLLKSKKSTLFITIEMDNNQLNLAMSRAVKMKYRLETIEKAVINYKNWQIANEKRNTTQSEVVKLNRFINISKTNEVEYNQQLNDTLKQIENIELDDAIMEEEKTKSLQENKIKLANSTNLEKELLSTIGKVIIKEILKIISCTRQFELHYHLIFFYLAIIFSFHS